jgi:hypothetical protein
VENDYKQKGAQEIPDNIGIRVSLPEILDINDSIQAYLNYALDMISLLMHLNLQYCSLPRK